ncbi:hypothetical protein AX16_006553 [Volvariella volvacea WC 439]|nr:hypothetical protein AX16_006553 [Volvariella volvacea WC 439]
MPYFIDSLLPQNFHDSQSASLAARQSDSELPEDDDWDAWYNSTRLHEDVRIPELGPENNIPNPGEVASLTTRNNFINYCAIVQGYEIIGEHGDPNDGFCTPAPIGVLPARDKIPSARIMHPFNNDVIRANEAFYVEMFTREFDAGSTAPPSKAWGAPQELIAQGRIDGHFHMVVEDVSSFDQRTPTDPQKFLVFREFFGGQVIYLDEGLPVGIYRLTVSLLATNHQPIFIPLARHGGIGDAIYFTVTADGSARSNSPTPRTISPRKVENPPIVIRKSTNLKRQLSFDDLDQIPRLDNRSIAESFRDDGMADFENPFQHAVVHSQTSVNNFINNCLPFTRNNTLANGTQPTTSVCNPVPIGVLPARRFTPSSKFVFPYHEVRVKTDTPFNITLAVNKFATGQYTNPETRFLAAPQQVNEQGLISGYASIVIERTEVWNADVEAMGSSILIRDSPASYLFFHSFNQPAVDGMHTVRLQSGLPEGYYRVTSMLKTANHAPIVTPNIERGALDDAIYFTVADDGIEPDLISNSSNNSATSSPGPKLGPIIGGSVGGFVAFILVLGCGMWWYKHNKAKHAHEVGSIRKSWTPWRRGEKEHEVPMPVSMPVDPYVLPPTAPNSPRQGAHPEPSSSTGSPAVKQVVYRNEKQAFRMSEVGNEGNKSRHSLEAPSYHSREQA